MNVRFQLMLPEEDHDEPHRLAGVTGVPTNARTVLSVTPGPFERRVGL